VPTSARPARVAVVLALEEPVPPDRAELSAEILLTAFDPDGKPRGSKRLSATATIRRGSTGQAAYELLSDIDLPPGRFQLRLAARSAALQQTGSIHADVEVPDYFAAPLSMSGVVLGIDPPRPSAPKDALAALVPIVPTAAREFVVTERVSAFLRVYQGERLPLDDVGVEARIVDARNRTVFSNSRLIPRDAFASRAAEYQLAVPLDRLDAGAHLLSFIARAGTRPIARRDVRFAVK
jgi:hypothetical protein